MAKMNILMVVADQLGAHALDFLGVGGAKAPNLAKMAGESWVYNDAHCSSPLCTPSRYGMMSGLFVKNHAGYDNASVLDSLVPTFAHYARLAGYETTLSGKMHFVGADQLHGFERRLTTDVYPADFGWVPDWTTEERIDLWYHNMSSVKQAGVAAITNQLDYDDEVLFTSKRALYHYARGNRERPFMMVTSFIHPHDPYAARKKYWDKYSNEEVSLPRRRNKLDDAHSQRLYRAIEADKEEMSDQQVLNARRAYYANVSMVDEYLGDLLDVLTETGLADDTIVIFTSDHGDFLGEYGLWYKMSFLNSASRVPLLVKIPHESARMIHNPVSLLDITPTLNDLVNYRGALAHRLDGFSLLSSERAPILTEYCAEGAREPMVMVKNQQYKLIYAPKDGALWYDRDDNLRSSNNEILDQELWAMAMNHWDYEAMRGKIIENQHRRRIIHSALTKGAQFSWDYQPTRNSADEFSRSHLDLTKFDNESRFPRAK